MAFGVCSSRVHLNALDTMHLEFANELDSLDSQTHANNEINWGALSQFRNNEIPAFAGRYFLGTPNREEIDNDIGFSLWSHGESSDFVTPDRIVPMQRSNRERQEVAGNEGQRFGTDDAYALGLYLQRCLDVGDLLFPNTAPFVLVFLEVTPTTQLSVDYWWNWASTIYSMSITTDPQSTDTLPVQPLLPALTCGFAASESSTEFRPEAAIRDCLNAPNAPRGRRHLCYGFWAINPLDEPVFEEFRQEELDWSVPVFYWRSYDPTVSTVPGGIDEPTLQTLTLVSLDEIHANGEDPLQFALRSGVWNPTGPLPTVGDNPATDTAESDFVFSNNSHTQLTVLPTEIGIDTAAYLNNGIAHQVVFKQDGNTETERPISIARLPAGFQSYDNGTDLTPIGGIIKTASFAGRYLWDHFNSIQPDEVREIIASGMQVNVFFQLGINPAGKGLTHGRRAFNSAHNLGQPPYTPIYFAVDADIDAGLTKDRGLQPTFAEAFTYFQNIRRAYRDYIADSSKTPYYIGCYGSSKLLSAVYRAGLASHFWQLWAPTYGAPVNEPEDWYKTCAGWRAWPHLNVWQIIIDGTDSELYDVWQDNDVDQVVGVDLNVAWGDSGAWEPRYIEVPVPTAADPGPEDPESVVPPALPAADDEVLP